MSKFIGGEIPADEISKLNKLVGDSSSLGMYANPTALSTAHPSPTVGSSARVVSTGTWHYYDGSWTDSGLSIYQGGIIHGTVDPVAGDGEDGYFYINTTTTTLFGAKASGAWPTGVPLIAPDSRWNNVDKTAGFTIASDDLPNACYRLTGTFTIIIDDTGFTTGDVVTFLWFGATCVPTFDVATNSQTINIPSQVSFLPRSRYSLISLKFEGSGIWTGYGDMEDNI